VKPSSVCIDAILPVKDDLIYVFFHGGYILRVDDTGARDTTFGTNGLASLATTINPERPDLNGIYRARFFDDHIAFGYNTMHPNKSPLWESGVIRVDYTGQVISRNEFPTGLIDGDLPHDILPLESGGGLRLTTTGNVYGYADNLQTDTTFGTNGVLAAPTSDRFGGDPDRIRSRLIETPNGWARLSITGTLKPADYSGVPKVEEFLPQHLLQENFTEAGTEEDAAFGWAWAAGLLPVETEVCDAPGVHSADTMTTDILAPGALIPVSRCSDTVWVRFDQTGASTAINQTAINQTGINAWRRADTTVCASGELLAYADQDGKATVDLRMPTA